MAEVANIAKIPELRKRLLFTVLMLGIYRIGIFVPTPGIDTGELSRLITTGTVFDIFNLFSGGALEQFSIFALGIMPYITSSIIFQLLSVAVPSIHQMQKEEGEAGRHKISQYTRYATVLISLVQGFGLTYGLKSQGIVLPGLGGFSFYLTTVVTLTAGTCFLMWLGEMITERGIGNGISMIIFGGIAARIPGAFRDAWDAKEQFSGLFGFLILILGIAAIIGFIIFMERAQRRIPVQYAKRVVGRKMFGLQSSHLPLKVNSSGVIPPIFASSVILFPATIAQFASGNETLKLVAGMLSGGWVYIVLYVTLIIFFCYFYTAVAFNPVDVSENLKKYGGYVPGIRPGQNTADFIDRILSRITLGGALYLSAICILPQLISQQFGIPSSLAYTFGGTSLLILVGVGMDTLAQVESHLLSRHYEGFLGAKSGGRFRGRSG